MDNSVTLAHATADLEARAAEVADLLRELANEKRLLILCRLVELGEMRVNDMAAAVGLSQSALSQHLARLRETKLVAFRRDSQTLWYRIADARIERLIGQLHSIFCPHDPRSGDGQ